MRPTLRLSIHKGIQNGIIRQTMEMRETNKTYVNRLQKYASNHWNVRQLKKGICVKQS